MTPATRSHSLLGVAVEEAEVVGGGGGTPQTVNIAPAADVYFENSNKLNNNLLKVENSGNRPRVSYLRFNVSGVSGSITEAKLRLVLPAQASGGDNGSGTISVYKGSGNDAWTEASITSGNVPSQGVLLGSKNGSFGYNTTHEFTLTYERQCHFDPEA